MIIVGLTGGIGSGKTTVAKQFSTLGIPTYIADDEAKKMMNTSKIIKEELIALFGIEAYINGTLNKPFIAHTIFNNSSYLKKMNAIIHPRIAKHFQDWVLQQNSTYVIKEVAILFENGGDKACDYVITVVADKTERVKRLLKRDNTTKDKIELIIKNQWTDEEKIKKSDFVIDNTLIESTKKQVLVIHDEILKK